MQITIEKNVPFTGGGLDRSIYPFRDLEIGDSFEVKLSDTRCKSLIGLQSTLANCAVAAIGRGKVRTKQFPDRNAVRCWRIA